MFTQFSAKSGSQRASCLRYSIVSALCTPKFSSASRQLITVMPIDPGAIQAEAQPLCNSLRTRIDVCQAADHSKGVRDEACSQQSGNTMMLLFDR